MQTDDAKTLRIRHANFDGVDDDEGFSRDFEGVLALLRRLRDPDGCPWDREQTPRTLVPHLLEEAHEAAEAIEAGDRDRIVDELGDLMLHLAFQIVIAEESDAFDEPRVAGVLIDKMIRRHPHVFGDAEYAGRGHQAMWEKLKREERAGGTGVIGSLPEGLPVLVRAYRIQQKVATVGFDWQAADGALAKLEEEIAETVRAEGDESPERLEEEYGDLLFAAVNWGRLLGVHAHTALQRANRKFEARFRRLEELADRRGMALEEQGLDALDALWEEVKEAERA
ncbi:MAG: nucleoside triphosphate pyrophosphohydrolase [Gemmatimonadota bacterium]